MEQKAATFNLPSRRSSWPGKDDEVSINQNWLLFNQAPVFRGGGGWSRGEWIRINLRIRQNSPRCVLEVPAADRLMTYWKEKKKKIHWNTHRPIISSLFWGTTTELAHVCCIERYRVKGLACYGKSTRDMWMSRYSAQKAMSRHSSDHPCLYHWRGIRG